MFAVSVQCPVHTPVRTPMYGLPLNQSDQRIRCVFQSVYNKSILLPCLETIRVSDRNSSAVIGRALHVTSPICGRIDWLTGPKIRIVGFSFAELEMDIQNFIYPCLGGVNIIFNRIFEVYDS